MLKASTTADLELEVLAASGAGCGLGGGLSD
jgi:hypothetical protein